MKKIILTIGVVAFCQLAKAQLTKDIPSIENKVTTAAASQENKGLQTALTQIIGGISPKALSATTTASGLLSKVNTATNAAGYGSVISSLASSIKVDSFVPGWAKLKAGFNEKATKAKSAIEVASLAGELVNNLKPNAFTSTFNKAGVLKALALVK